MNNTAQGWTSTPNNRGTFDILRSCVQTIALCAWTSICVNIPAPDYKDFDLIRDKFYFVLLTLLGPELVLLLAASQYASARASVSRFKESGYGQWTLIHGFYADMGGIHVRDKDWKSFPVNAKQLHYLIMRGYMAYPEISVRDIKARSKIDGLAMLITIGQTLYFLVSSLARIQQGLTLTTMELTVIGFIFCSIVTTFCWWSKPHDVEVGHNFDLMTSIHRILAEGGEEASSPYQQTPLDFVSREEWMASNLWNYFVGLLRNLGLKFFFPETRKERPIRKFSSFDFPKPQSITIGSVCLCFALLYCAIFFAGWNYHFPTWQEKLGWRIFCITQIAIVCCIGIFEIGCHNSFTSFIDRAEGASIARATSWDAATRVYSKETQEASTRSIVHLWNAPLNNSISRHPRLSVPLRALLVTTPLCAVYVLCRWFLLSEDIVGLRSLPPEAFITVDWTKYWPLSTT